MKVLVFGTFDHLHPGHRFVLDEASKRGSLFVVVARDRTVEHIKGRIADQSEDVRLQAVQDAYPDAHIVLGDNADYLKPVRDSDPDLILMGYDQGFPPGVSEDDIPYPIERLEPFYPEKYKSSRLRNS